MKGLSSRLRSEYNVNSMALIWLKTSKLTHTHMWKIAHLLMERSYSHIRKGVHHTEEFGHFQMPLLSILAMPP